MTQRLWRCSIALLTAMSILTMQAASAADKDKQLVRVKGSVGYKSDANAKVKPIAGQQVLPDEAFAVTDMRSIADLNMPDSSVITIGEATEVQVGAFNSAIPAGSKITLKNGALKFSIKHPSGAQANYQFITPTSSIGVRGTEGYLVVGNNGTQLVCVACAAGDVTVSITATGVTTALVSGQVLTITGTPAAATSVVGTTANLNTPAVNQFSNGANPFGNAAQVSNPTGATSGTSVGSSAAAAPAAAGAAVSGTTAAVAAVAAGGLAVAVSQPPQLIPSPQLTFNPSSLSFTGVGQTQMFQISGMTSTGTPTSANTGIATVSGTGPSFMVTSVAPGTTTITVTAAGGVSGVLTVMVARTVVQPSKH
ncbi:MAG: hypothetical protein NVSMB31_12500 [Vulcanimicrobiaceae bacterium]